MRRHLWILCTAVATMTACAAPNVAALPAQLPPSTVPSRSDDLRGLLSAALAGPNRQIKLIVAGRKLTVPVKTALRSLGPNLIEEGVTTDLSSLEVNTVHVERVEISGDTARVRLFAGPMTSEVSWVCGLAMTVTLQRKIIWQLIERGPVKCAQPGPAGLTPGRSDLLEAARLVFTEMRLSPATRVAHGAALSAEALATLKSIRDVPEGKQFETPTMWIPGGVIVINRLARDGDVVEFTGTSGPYQRNSNLDCGVTHRYRLEQRPDGWVFGLVTVSMC